MRGRVGAGSGNRDETGRIAGSSRPAPAQSGTLEMRDDPTDAATTMVSMFQTNSVAVRALLWCAIEPLRDNPLAYLDLEEPSGF